MTNVLTTLYDIRIYMGRPLEPTLFDIDRELVWLVSSAEEYPTMKYPTIENVYIGSLDRAKIFVCWLIDNKLDYHFDDGAHDCLRNCGFTATELDDIQIMADAAQSWHERNGECIFATLLEAGSARDKW